MDKLILLVEAKSTKKELPKFEVGDTVEVYVSIVEGDKTRTQVFTGLVIGRGGRGINETVTVRRIVQGEGVERVFPLHSPAVQKIEVVRHGVTRRAKLYYMRGRTGKSVRLRERIVARPQVKKIKKARKKIATPELPGEGAAPQSAEAGDKKE